MPEAITTDMLYAAMREASVSRATGGVTVHDLVEKYSIGEKRIRDMLRPLVESKKVYVVKVPRPAIDGAMRQVPTYILKGGAL